MVWQDYASNEYFGGSVSGNDVQICLNFQVVAVRDLRRGGLRVLLNKKDHRFDIYMLRQDVVAAPPAPPGLDEKMETTKQAHPVGVLGSLDRSSLRALEVYAETAESKCGWLEAFDNARIPINETELTEKRVLDDLDTVKIWTQMQGWAAEQQQRQAMLTKDDNISKQSTET